MSLLKALATDASITPEKDSVGSGGLLDSGLYAGKVSLAYLSKSAGGALALVLNIKTEAGRELRQSLWMTSGDAKGNKTTYERDGVKHYLPGFNLSNSLALLTTGKELSELDTETKVVNVYSYDAKAEVPTKVEVMVDMLGKDILVGVIKQTVDKNIKNDAGKYVPSGDTRDENEIDKFFRARDRMTTVEILAKAETAVFANTWENQWAGKSRDKTDKKGAAAGSKAGAPAAAVSSQPKASLFA